jgi:hypothetical protein
MYGFAGLAVEVPPHQVRFIRNSPTSAASADAEINSDALAITTATNIEPNLCRLQIAI